MDKANESLGAAERLIEARSYEEAVLRCYHAAFFILRAFLKKKEIVVEKTSDSVSVFKKNFIDTHLINESLYVDLLKIMEAGGNENSTDLIATDETSSRKIFEIADRFYSELTDLI